MLMNLEGASKENTTNLCLTRAVLLVYRLDEHFKPKVDDATGYQRGDCLVGDEAVIAK